MPRVSAVTIAAGCLAFGAYAQNAAPRPSFEVASVKRVTEDSTGGGGARSTGMPPPLPVNAASVNYSAVNLLGVVARAYGLRPLEIVAPEWLRNEFYNIAAKAPPDAPMGQVPAMLQTLLAERFHMMVHWETQEVRGYALLVGQSGPRLKKSALPDDQAASRKGFGFTGQGHLTFRASTLEDVAANLTGFLGQPVVDLTGVPGYYDITLDAAPDSMPGLPTMGATRNDATPLPTIFDAIRELGLNLEARRRVSVKRLVVDSAQKVPTEN